MISFVYLFVLRSFKGQLQILLDGGITSCLSIALTVSAKACMIGKPWIYRLSTRSEKGVNDIFNNLKK